MLTLKFEGFFQCRLATDPDPTDDRRGISGPTFTAPGEADLDRIIRLQDPVNLRLPFRYEDFGVNVTTVEKNGAPIAGHPLIGADVELLDGAKFEGRNFIIAGTGREPIDPFHICITGGGITLSRKDLWDPQNPSLGILQVSPDLLARRQPSFVVQDPEVQEAMGVLAPEQYRQDRRNYLLSILNGYTDPIKRAACQKRIDFLNKDNEGYAGITMMAQIVLTVKETFKFEINGPAQVSDPNRVLGTVGTTPFWPIEFWMGGYDCDTMVGYMRGKLSLPVYPLPRDDGSE